MIERTQESAYPCLERSHSFRVERLLAQAWRVLLARDLAGTAAPCHTMYSGGFTLLLFQMAKKSLVRNNQYEKGVGR